MKHLLNYNFIFPCLLFELVYIHSWHYFLGASVADYDLIVIQVMLILEEHRLYCDDMEFQNYISVVNKDDSSFL